MMGTWVASTESAAGDDVVSLLTQDPDQGWRSFIERYAGLIFSLIHHRSFDYDQMMDQFVYVCGKLAEAHCRRLKMIHYVSNGDLGPWVRAVVEHECINWLWSVEGRNRLPRAISR